MDAIDNGLVGGGSERNSPHEDAPPPTTLPSPPFERSGFEAIDWGTIRREILERLDVAAEYQRLGVEFTKPQPNPKGWRECRAFGREDLNPSAGVNVRTGCYNSFGEEGEYLNLFDFAVKYGPMGTYIDSLRHYADKAGIDLPDVRQDTQGSFVEAVYRYEDASGTVVYETIRYRKPDGGKRFLQRRPDGRGGYSYNLDGISPLPYKLPELLAADPLRLVWVVEGEKDVERAIAEGLVATCNNGGTGNTKVWKELAPFFEGRNVVVVADNDEPGRRHARGVAGYLESHAATVRVIDLFDVPAKGDVSDLFDGGHTSEELEELTNVAPIKMPGTNPLIEAIAEAGDLESFLADPPDPKPIRDELRPVAPLLPEFLPAPLRPWLADIAERMQCPLEFVAVGAIVAIASVVGRRMMIRPKRRDNWTVVPNLWGAIVGRPGVMKTPALAEVLKPIGGLEERARQIYQEELARYEQDALLAKARLEEAQRELKALMREKGSDEQSLREIAAQAVAAQKDEPPAQRRYKLNDSTIEMLGEILMGNPNGVLIFRDELTGWLRGLDKPGREQDRAFHLEGWNGDDDFTVDRIGRGTRYIRKVCTNILGGIQPGPLGKYFEAAAKHGSEDDGLISRFQLLVFPDDLAEWRNVDEWPDFEARERAYRVFDKLDQLDPLATGAEFDKYDGQPFLRFTPEAQELFDVWREDLENTKLRAMDEDPLVVSHLAKYRSLMPALALLFHLIEVVDGTAAGPVSLGAAKRAAAWCDMLEGHARRIYEGFGDPAIAAARRLAARIKKGDVPDQFPYSWVAQRGWTGLDSASDVELATARLEALGWVYREVVPPGPMGGRPKSVVHVNPKLREGGP